jgi:hypothetical protein
MFLQSIVIAGSELPTPAAWEEVLKQGGPFAAGTIVGCVVAYWMFSLASKERVERHKIDLEREKELLRQSGIKDSRIDELHKRLEECINRQRKGGK